MQKLVKKSIAIFSAFLLACPLKCNAADVQYGPQPDNSFLTLTGTRISQTEIDNSEVKPVLSLSKTTIDSSYDATQPVPVTLSVKGADKKWSCLGIHIYFDERLSLVKKDSNKIKYQWNDAAEDISIRNVSNSDNWIFITCADQSDSGFDGEIFTFYVNLPDNLSGGENFPIEIKYEYNIKDKLLTADMFTNRIDPFTNDELMNAYTFTKGIDNGYIKINNPPVTTTTTTTSTSTTTSTTTTIATTTSSSTTSTTTTSITTTTSTTFTTTSTTTSTSTTTKPVITTTTTVTTTPVVTTTNSLGDIDSDGNIDASDASMALQIYVCKGTNGDLNKEFTQLELLNADVDFNGIVDASDASKILAFYTYHATNGKLSFREYIKEN